MKNKEKLFWICVAISNGLALAYLFNRHPKEIVSTFSGWFIITFHVAASIGATYFAVETNHQGLKGFTRILSIVACVFWIAMGIANATGGIVVFSKNPKLLATPNLIGISLLAVFMATTGAAVLLAYHAATYSEKRLAVAKAR